MQKIDTIVGAFMQLREQHDAVKQDAKNKMDELKGKMSHLEAMLLTHMDEQGVETCRTQHGTVYKTTTDFASVADWDAVIEYVKANDAYHLFDKRVNKLAVRDYVGNGLPPPPGVNYGERIDVQIRKPTTKV